MRRFYHKADVCVCVCVKTAYLWTVAVPINNDEIKCEGAKKN